ncbi:hypothetical protein, partial [Burkholderia ubonensis]|uniref:hypothetical protein n=1 Tax=Burkholderia ubonensis TaxID=101571 RepID=UPI002ABD5842
YGTHMRCHENGRSRGVRRREYWTIAKEHNAASGRSCGNPKLKNSFQGNARNRPHGGVARRLFDSAKRRSFLLALRAISGIRMCVPYVNRP